MAVLLASLVGESIFLVWLLIDRALFVAVQNGLMKVFPPLYWYSNFFEEHATDTNVGIGSMMILANFCLFLRAAARSNYAQLVRDLRLVPRGQQQLWSPLFPRLEIAVWIVSFVAIISFSVALDQMYSELPGLLFLSWNLFFATTAIFLAERCRWIGAVRPAMVWLTVGCIVLLLLLQSVLFIPCFLNLLAAPIACWILGVRLHNAVQSPLDHAAN